MSEVLDRYAFLPWVRRGLAAKIAEVDNLNDFGTPPPGGWALERPKLKIKAKITATKNGGAPSYDQVLQDVDLVGPGDIIGIDQNVVIKTEPKHWVTNVEPNYFPYIQFYEEDFPWRYSPATANAHRLRPWIVLIALKPSEFEKDIALFGSLPSIRIVGHEDDAPGTTGAASKVFPNPAQTWAWCHVHFNGDLDPTNALAPEDISAPLDRFRSVVASNPDLAYSRIICPRKLDANTTYHCFLVPAFETGRLAGLGADEALIATHLAQEASFGAAHSTDGDHLQYADHFPVYYEWQFMTGDVGDFESLVRKLVPREVDQRVGRRPFDIQNPGFNIHYGADPVPGDGTVLIEGVMLPPIMHPAAPGALPVYAHPWDPGIGTQHYREHLADLLNLGEDLQAAVFPPSNFHGTNPFGYTSGSTDTEDDPFVVPDIYGRWHALKSTVNASPGHYHHWLDELNLDPRHRAVAGMGVKYIKEHQEVLMDRAWEQLGEVIEANRRLKWGQLAQRTAKAAYDKHLKHQPAEQASAMAGKMFGKVKEGAMAASKVILDSPMPPIAQSAVYRKIERPNGPLMKRLDPTQSLFSQNNLRVSMANASLPAAIPKVFSTFQAHMNLSPVDTDVSRIVNHTIVSAMYAPTEPGSLDMVPNLQSEQLFREAVERYNDYFADDNWPDVAIGGAISLGTVTANVIGNISPMATIPKAVYAGLHFGALQGYILPPPERIVPVMAYPVFPEPTYEAVKDLSVDYLVPNLKLIPDNSVTLLESNQRFVEAFLVGMNHEMGRELLWREYPTDQRGSYFRQFWDSKDAVNAGGATEKDHALQNLDIDEIHTWIPSSDALGTHSPRPGGGTGLLILVIRGDLLKKYPHTVIYAQKAKFQVGDATHSLPRELDTEIRTPIFSARVEPDIYFIGFNLTADVAKGNRDTGDPGWFFVLHERPGEIRFGVDVTRPATDTSPNPHVVSQWDDLWVGKAPFTGVHLDTTHNAVTATDNRIDETFHVEWGLNATNMAEILFQEPVLLAVHSDEMIA